MSNTDTPVAIQILAFEGCMSSAVAGLLDAFAIANMWAASLASPRRFEPVVLASSPVVRGSGGMHIPAQPLQGAGHGAVAIVPPIMAPPQEVLQSNRPLVDWLRAAPQGTVLASVCAGAFFLGEAGRLDGATATTNPSFAPAFRARYPNVHLRTQERLIDHGGVICAGSTTAFLTLAVYLVERFAGHDLAVHTAKSLAMDKNPTSQLPYAVATPLDDHADALVQTLQRWIGRAYKSPIGVVDVAAQACLSPRALRRRFTAATGLAPLEYLHQVRIGAAKKLLEATALTVESITQEVGYQDPRAFGRLFRRHTGLSPAAYRSRFGWGG